MKHDPWLVQRGERKPGAQAQDLWEKTVDDHENSFSELFIDEQDSIRSALSLIDRLGIDRAFVADRRRMLKGCVAREHVHRALLDGCALYESVTSLVQPVVTTARATDGRAEVLDLMRALRIRELPIVDGHGRLVGIHVEDQIIGPVKRDNWAVIMVGGKGTRLGSLTRDTPKPMLPIAGRPILERLVLHLVGSGITKIFLSVNYLAEKIEKHFGDGGRFGCSIEYLREETDRPLGTGGSLRLLNDLGYRPQAPLLVMNGDLVTAFSVSHLLQFHQAHKNVVTIAASEYQHQVPFGVLHTDDGRLSRIVEKPTHSCLVNAGIYAIDPELLTEIPANVLYPITELFSACLRRGKRIGVWQLDDGWQDIGRPDELAKARGEH